MSKKVTISLVLTLIIAMLTTSLVLAADPSSTTTSQPGIRIGMITSVSQDEIILKNTAGKEKTILLSSTTKYIKINGVAKGWKDLSDGAWIIAVGTINENKELAANFIVLSPRKIHMGAWTTPRQFGSVASVNVTAGTLRLSTTNAFSTFHVDSRTRYFGMVKNLGALNAGMEVVISYRRSSGGVQTIRSLLALP